EDVHDPPAAGLPHVRHAQSHAADGREEFELEVGLPGRVVDTVEASGRGGPGIVDQDVEPPEAFDGRGHELLEVTGAHDIRLNVVDFRAVAPGPLRRFFQTGRVAPADRDGGPFSGESSSGGEAETVGAASDDGDPVL